jgi:hypothetical protein
LSAGTWIALIFTTLMAAPFPAPTSANHPCGTLGT